MKYQIKPAKPEQAAEIATLIMEAMDADCCQNFAGPHHTLADFHRLITRLVGMEERNTAIKTRSPPCKDNAL